jgi:hypothetical protein
MTQKPKGFDPAPRQPKKKEKVDLPPETEFKKPNGFLELGVTIFRLGKELVSLGKIYLEQRLKRSQGKK